MTLNTGRIAWCAAAAGTAFFAWRKLGMTVRGELGLRASCAGNALLGNPVAYRVLVLKDGDGPGIEVHGGPATVSSCTVVGIRSDAMRLDLAGAPFVIGPYDPAAGEAA